MNVEGCIFIWPIVFYMFHGSSKNASSNAVTAMEAAKTIDK
jgi:hypothetical protein